MTLIKSISGIRGTIGGAPAEALTMDGDFNPKRDIANFYYSFDGKSWTQIGGDYKMIFDYTRLFMGSRYAAFYYSTKQVGGSVSIDYNF